MEIYHAASVARDEGGAGMTEGDEKHMAVRRRPVRLDSEIRRPDGRPGAIHIERLILGAVQTNCYLLENREKGEAVILDPADEAAEIAAALTEKDLQAAAILLTHGHFDHGLAAAELSARFHAPIHAAEAERELLSDPYLTASFLVPGVSYCLKPDVLLSDRQELTYAGIRLLVLHTPGHTAGGVSFYLPDYQVVFSGDTLFCGGIGRTDLPTGNMGQLLRSILNVLLELPDGVMVLPGHGGSTTVGLERRYNPYLEESGFWE